MGVLELWQSLVGGYTLSLFLALPAIYLISHTVYLLYFHPLAKYPGPFFHRISRIPYFYKHINGTLPFDMLGMHEHYGNIVRVQPDELAISSPDAWNDIMGHAAASGKGGISGNEELKKADWFYHPAPTMSKHIVNETREKHGRLRRTMAHSFSEKSMRAQEPIIAKYVDLLISQITEKAKAGPVVMSDWYNFCTFDVIGDLAFGEAFGCLAGSDYHAWIKGIFSSSRLGTILQALAFVPWLKTMLLQLVPKNLKDSQQLHKQMTRAKMLRRMEAGMQRPDLIEGLLQKQEELGLSLDEIVANAEILIIAGSETTATLLSGVTYYLLANPKVLAKLTAEVRSSFESESEIDLLSVGRLSYMLACLNEAMRMYPPVANGLPRLVPPSGVKIAGEYIPGNVTVAVHHWSLYRRPAYWRDPNSYHPERFLGDPDYASDRRDALQPFHVGPRNCLGRNLAYSEMRLILARVVWNFDMEIADESRDWVEQRNYLFWKKGPLKVHLTKRTAA